MERTAQGFDIHVDMVKVGQCFMQADQAAAGVDSRPLKRPIEEVQLEAEKHEEKEQTDSAEPSEEREPGAPPRKVARSDCTLSA